MKNRYTLLLFLLCSLTFTSCDDWLDVKPETEIEGSDLFSSETGFKDALTGAYIQMSDKSLYGKEMTFGLVDCLGDAYYQAGSSYNGAGYYYAWKHQYDNIDTEALINGVWTKAYSTIAILNELLTNLEQANASTFSNDNYNVIKGEALGLRAFLHFDLLRLFAPSWKVDKAAKAIPYVTEYSYNVTPSSTVEEAIGKVLNDLTEAAALLKESDPIATGRTITTADDNGYLLNRQYHFNYYAVKATMARAYLFKDDLTNAANCAHEVINSGKYTWTEATDIATGQEANMDRTFISEQIFALQIDNLNEYVLGYTYGTLPYNAKFVWEDYWVNRYVFPTATHNTDYRKIYLFSNQYTGSSYNYTSKKLWQEGMDAGYVKRMPMIRLPEMYLILAQAEMENAVQYLNEIRTKRGVITPYIYTDDVALVDEMYSEYTREFVGEGLLFHFQKRLNLDTHNTGYNFKKTAFDTSLYVLPMPEEEIEFGKRN